MDITVRLTGVAPGSYNLTIRTENIGDIRYYATVRVTVTN